MLLSGSVPRQAFDKALAEGKPVVSVPIIFELAEVLSRKHLTTVTISECRDPKDNKFLELAVSAKADCIISGDNDLLVLNPLRKILIITPGQFLNWNR